MGRFEKNLSIFVLALIDYQQSLLAKADILVDMVKFRILKFQKVTLFLYSKLSKETNVKEYQKHMRPT